MPSYAECQTCVRACVRARARRVWCISCSRLTGVTPFADHTCARVRALARPHTHTHMHGPACMPNHLTRRDVIWCWLRVRRVVHNRGSKKCCVAAVWPGRRSAMRKQLSPRVVAMQCVCVCNQDQSATRRRATATGKVTLSTGDRLPKHTARHVRRPLSLSLSRHVVVGVIGCWVNWVLIARKCWKLLRLIRITISIAVNSVQNTLYRQWRKAFRRTSPAAAVVFTQVALCIAHASVHRNISQWLATCIKFRSLSAKYTGSLHYSRNCKHLTPVRRFL